MKTVRAYVRVSTHKQAQEGYSLETQETRIREYCKFYNLPAPIIYADKGISAKRAKNRPDFQRLLNEVQNGDTVLIYALSRFARNTLETLQIAQGFKKRDIALVSVTEKAIDTSDANGELILTIMAALAQFDNQKKGEYISDHLQIRKERKQTYARQITGYKNTYDLTPDGKRTNGRLEPTEHLQTVKTIFELHAAGRGAYAIASILNKKGIKPPTGRKYYQSSVLSILTNEIHIK